MITTTLILTLLFSSPQVEKIEKQKLEVQALYLSIDLTMVSENQTTEIAEEVVCVVVDLNARKPQKVAFLNFKEFPTGFT